MRTDIDAADPHEGAHGHAGSEHVVSPSVYLGVFVALLVLLVATVAAAEVDLGSLNTPVALTIAVAKMVLVILYFMHVRYGSRLTWLVVTAAFFFLAVMIAGTMDDVITRGWLGVPGS